MFGQQVTMTEEQRINACKPAISQIYNMLRSSPQEWQSVLNLARTVIAQLDSTTFMQQTARTAEQVWMIAALQTIAFQNVDSGAILDIASWCSRQWLVIVQRDAQNLSALRGLGQMWLSRAQPALAHIHSSQGPSSSKGSESAAEAERRIGAADYVEARGFLQPAIEYLERAVAAASGQNAVSDDLLVKVCDSDCVSWIFKGADVAHRTGSGGIHVTWKRFESPDKRTILSSRFAVAAACVSNARLYVAQTLTEVSPAGDPNPRIVS
jgi:hypothetical protein